MQIMLSKYILAVSDGKIMGIFLGFFKSNSHSCIMHFLTKKRLSSNYEKCMIYINAFECKALYVWVGIQCEG